MDTLTEKVGIYSQRTVLCTKIAQCLRDPGRLPDARTALFSRGADYLEGMAAAYAFTMRSSDRAPTHEALGDLVFLARTGLEEYPQIVDNLAPWGAALRSGEMPEELRLAMISFFSKRGLEYSHAHHDAACLRSCIDDE